MYNSDKPTREDLPSTRQLIKSTIIAMVSAAAILVFIVLPAEYAVDPTGVGRALGLTEMGEIKSQLSKEADEDRARERKTAPDRKSGLLDRIFSGILISSAHAQSTPATRSDEVKISLRPGEGKEVKLRMKKGAKVSYIWKVEGGVANFDLHGDGSGRKISYKRGRAKPGGEGVLVAAFTGNHGWFWRNRTRNTVTVILRTQGDYSSIKQMR